MTMYDIDNNMIEEMEVFIFEGKISRLVSGLHHTRRAALLFTFTIWMSVIELSVWASSFAVFSKIFIETRNISSHICNFVLIQL